MAHQLIVNKFSLEPDGTIKVWLKVDLEEITFLMKREGFGYTVPGALENLTTKNLKRSQSFITLLDDWYNDLPVSLPIDLTFSNE